MKRYSSVLLALLLTLSLSACGDGAGSFIPSASNDTIATFLPGDLSVSDGSSRSVENLPDENQGLDNSVQKALEGGRSSEKSGEGNKTLDEDGWYTSKDEVALYIHLYGDLPGNYVTKKEAEDAGWHGGNVERYIGEGTAIGGSRFNNREGLLPEEKGRTYTEGDIDTTGENSRGAKRIVFSNDGLISYTDDHYESFELLYGEP